MTSVEYTFTLDGDRLSLKSARACLASARPSDDVLPRENITGSWVEYADATGRIIYRTDVYALLYAISEVGFTRLDEFSVLLPADERAATIRVFAPPLDASSRPQPFGPPSVLLGQFAVPDVAAPTPRERPQLPADLCGKGRGRVLRCTQIRDRGAVTDVKNLVILADKFGSGEQKEFVDRAHRCVNFLMSRPPFSSTIGYDSLNVWIVEVESTDPNRSYFDVHTDPDIDGGTDWNDEDVAKVCDALFSGEDGGKYWHWAGLIVNGEFRGKRRGSQFVVAKKDRASMARTFQHELGHAAFSLADEYVEFDEKYTGSEPDRPNVTIQADRTHWKWGRLVQADTPVPTPDSFYKNNRAAVGFYEGGHRYASGIYRPHKVCVMNDHKDKDVDGKFCSVCLDNANVIIYSTLSAFVPVPGIVQYSPVDGRWSNLTTSASIEKRYSSFANYDRFDALVDELRQGALAAKDSPARYVLAFLGGVSIGADATVIRTHEDGLSARGLWYVVDKKSGAMYYIGTFRTQLAERVLAGKIKLPSIPHVGQFDGVTNGREQHVFYIDDGHLAQARLTARGEFVQDFATQQVNGLGSHLESVSTAFKKSRIWLAVVDGGTVKVGYYSLVSQSWDPAGFVTLEAAAGLVFAEAKVTQIDPFVYVLARHAGGVVLAVFDPMTMAWRGQAVVTVSENRDVIALDLARYQNTLWLTMVRPDRIEVVTYDLLRQQVVDTTHRLRERPALVTSFGTTVLGNAAHWVAIVDGKAQHETLTIEWDAAKSCYTMIPSAGPRDIDVLNQTGADVAALALHNNGEMIYAMLSQHQEVAGVVDLWNQAATPLG